MIISGHTHSAKVEERAGVLCSNRGSAGGTFDLPVTLAKITVSDGVLRPRIVPL